MLEIFIWLAGRYKVSSIWRTANWEQRRCSKGLALERSAVWADGSMKSESGTYALILQSRQETKVQIGRWRQIDVEQGYYVYVGSAFGPGGVRSRVARHYRSDKPLRWHIDYLREHLMPLAAWYSHEPDRLEHRWAHVFSTMGDMVPIEGFGCSDCKCHTHLFRTSEPPDLVRFSRTAGGMVESWPCQDAG